MYYWLFLEKLGRGGFDKGARTLVQNTFRVLILINKRTVTLVKSLRSNFTLFWFILCFFFLFLPLRDVYNLYLGLFPQKIKISISLEDFLIFLLRCHVKSKISNSSHANLYILIYQNLIKMVCSNFIFLQLNRKHL